MPGSYNIWYTFLKQEFTLLITSTVPSQEDEHKESKLNTKKELPQEAAPQEHEEETDDGK